MVDGGKMKTTFQPKTPMTIQTQNGYDEFGRPAFKPAVKVFCTPIRFEIRQEKTSVRTDKSASKSAAEEPKAMARLLVHPDAVIKNGDKVVCRGVALKVIEVFERVTLFNSRHHWQVDCEIWPPE
jgi:hypothetical protein